MTWRSSAAAAAVLLAAAGAVVAADGQEPLPAQPSVRPRQVPVTAATLSCPPAPGAAGSTTTLFAVGRGATATSAGTPKLRLMRGTGAGGRLVAATSVPGVPLRVALPPAGGQQGGQPPVRSAQPGALVTATGALAPGLMAAELSTYRGNRVSGTAATSCAVPRGQWWFNGVATTVGTTTTLDITNASPGIAVIDVQIFGPGGLVSTDGAHDVAIAPRSQQRLDLAGLAPGRPALTLHVTATRGTVSAAVSTTRLDALTPTGSDWVPPSTGPARTVVVDAGVARATSQRLVITNPGSRQQLVSVRFLDPTGAFVSTGLADVQVPPGSVVVKDITSITRHRPSAVELSSATPVTGAVLSRLSGPRADFAVSGVSERLTDPAVVPRTDGATLTISVTASTPGVRTVHVRTIGRSGSPLGDHRLIVHGATTTSWTLPTGSAASYLVIRSDDGAALQAVATYAGPGGIAQLPVLPGRWTVIQPVVVPSP